MSRVGQIRPNLFIGSSLTFENSVLASNHSEIISSSQIRVLGDLHLGRSGIRAGDVIIDCSLLVRDASTLDIGMLIVAHGDCDSDDSVPVTHFSRSNASIDLLSISNRKRSSAVLLENSHVRITKVEMKTNPAAIGIMKRSAVMINDVANGLDLLSVSGHSNLIISAHFDIKRLEIQDFSNVTMNSDASIGFSDISVGSTLTVLGTANLDYGIGTEVNSHVFLNGEPVDA